MAEPQSIEPTTPSPTEHSPSEEMPAVRPSLELVRPDQKTKIDALVATATSFLKKLSPQNEPKDGALPPPPQPLGHEHRLLQMIADRLLRLSRHVVNACRNQKSQSREMDVRSDSLKKSLSDASNEMKVGQDFAVALEETITQQVNDVNQRINENLARIMTSMEERTQRAREFLDFIETLSQQSQLLSFNAAIEATRAGAQGRAFVIIAETIRNMAEQTSRGSEQASVQLNLKDVREELDRFKTETSTAFENLVAEVRDSMENLRAVFNHISQNLDNVKQNNQVIFELIRSDAMLKHAIMKSEWSMQLSGHLLEALRSSDSPSSVENHLLEVIDEDAISRPLDEDLLDEIIKRGRLRVAIEPSFVGLSFRPSPDEPLRGLDVDYVQAFAEWLGVEVEFIEYPWDRCPELLETGPEPGSPPADLMWSALPPADGYPAVAFSESYTHLEYVLARRKNDTRINGIKDLEGKVLGCIKDPAAITTLERLGLRWSENENLPGGTVRLANLISYSDQTRIHECLADGTVDAFAVDRPIYHWAATSPQSPWYGKVEILNRNLSPTPWHYAVGVLASPRSYRLLKKINEFIRWFKNQPQRKSIEVSWQGMAISSKLSYRDEPGQLLGIDEIAPQNWHSPLSEPSDGAKT